MFTELFPMPLVITYLAIFSILGWVNSIVMHRRFPAVSRVHSFSQGVVSSLASVVAPSFFIWSLEHFTPSHSNPVGLLFILPPVLLFLVFVPPIVIHLIWTRRVAGKGYKGALSVIGGVVAGIVVILGFFIMRPILEPKYQGSLRAGLIPRDSEEKGWVSLKGFGNRTQVDTYILWGFPPKTLQPAHIHKGTCEMSGEIVFNLRDLKAESEREGSSNTWIDKPMQDIAALSPLMAEVHRSKTDNTRVACGNIDSQIKR